MNSYVLGTVKYIKTNRYQTQPWSKIEEQILLQRMVPQYWCFVIATSYLIVFKLLGRNIVLAIFLITLFVYIKKIIHVYVYSQYFLSLAIALTTFQSTYGFLNTLYAGCLVRFYRWRELFLTIMPLCFLFFFSCKLCYRSESDWRYMKNHLSDCPHITDSLQKIT